MSRFGIQYANLENNVRLRNLTRRVGDQVAHQVRSDQAPIAFFNASTRIGGVSQNAAFSFLSACGVQLAGVPVVNFACKYGLSRCVLGTNKDDHTQKPPCASCTTASRWLFANAPTIPLKYSLPNNLAKDIAGLAVDELSDLTIQFPPTGQSIPLGRLVMPSLRWALRRHHLTDDEPTRFLLREYILSAFHLAVEFHSFLDQVEPQALVVFNGIMYPEAAARWTALQSGLRVITHEVGLMPFSCFFTNGDATAYPIDIPDSFQLSPAQNTRLDAYLELRFQGKFTMAGIRFWPEMSGLEPSFVERIKQFRQMVPVFTNVIFDTSQIHANIVFEDMFAWLDAILELIRIHPETLFVIRAHPDEMRPGKESRESVADWIRLRQVEALSNVVFFDSHELISSYELIRRAKFALVYNSSIGLEAALMGAAVLNGGKARYTQLPIVYFPATPEAYRAQAEQFLADPTVEADPQFRVNARRFLYYQLFRTSIPFGEFLELHPNPTMVRLKKFAWQRLAPGGSEVIQLVVNGILHDTPFLLDASD